MLYPIHTKVPGRARFKVEGLYCSESLKRFLESRLPHQEGISSASASATTGNLLVFFSLDNDHQGIAEVILAILEEEGGPRRRPEDSASENPGSPSPSTISLWPAAIKEKVTRLLSPKAKQREELWHLMDGDSVLALLESDKTRGISNQTAGERLQLYGPNVLPEPIARSRWGILIDQLKSLPVLLLAGAAGLSILTGGFLDAVVIMGVVFANAAIGFKIESDAEKTIRSLKGFVRPVAEVRREGRVTEISAGEMVVGDIFVLKPGTYISADSRLLESSLLSVDESVLTGESMPVSKIPKTLEEKNLPLADRINMVYMGTLVTGGEGLAVVVSTGENTEMGRLQLLLGETTAPETPFERQLGVLGDQLVLLCAAICGVVFIIGLLRGQRLLEMMRLAVSLAAAAVPEGLPAAATINFALGIKNMKRHHVLVRRLQAIETLGAVQTVCLDKTGTLTWNRMSVRRIHTGMKQVSIENGHFRLEDRLIEPLKMKALRQLMNVCVLCSETKINGGDDPGQYVLKGSATENALVDLAFAAGIDVREVRGEYPILSIDHRAESRLFMTTRHASPDGRNILLALKGSPMEVLAMCTWQLEEGEKTPLTEREKLLIGMENDRMAASALRVLGVAFTTLDPEDKSRTNGDLIWLGLVGMADPIREGANELIRCYHQAGIKTIMITGDQSATAYTIATQLNLSQEERLEILDSTDLPEIRPELLQALAKRVHVFARVSPSNKLQIVRALQDAGQVVAMTGDGINDGPALKAADIGIAMGKGGTDVAREVADVVLEDDNLETLIIAVRDGRATYNNIRKSVHFFLSTNFTEIMVMFGALAAGMGSPLNVMQLLWINLISDIFPGLALSMELPEPDVLEQPPRDPREPLLSSRDFRRMSLESAVISASALGAYGLGIALYGIGARAGTLAFHSLTTGQLLHALSCRSEKHTIFDERQPPPNRYLYAALGGSLFFQLLAAFVPGLRRFLGLTPINALDALVIGGSALLPLAVNELTKSTVLAPRHAGTEKGQDDRVN